MLKYAMAIFKFVKHLHCKVQIDKKIYIFAVSLKSHLLVN